MSATRNLKEGSVQKQCIDLLEAEGWMVLRLQVGSFQRRGAWLSVGKKGMPDTLAIRPNAHLFVEVKRNKGGRLSADQINWHVSARRRGFQVVVISEIDELKAVLAETRCA